MNNKFLQQNTKGAALLIFVVFFMVASITLVYGISHGVYKDLLQYRTFSISKEVFFATEAGVEDAIHRHRNNKNYSNTENFTIDSVTVDATRAVVSDHFELNFTGVDGTITRKAYLEFTVGNGASFSYGLQSDTGGIVMENSSSVLGNIYSNGTVVGAGGNDVFGTVISAGPAGYVEGIHATGTVYAHDIVDSIIDMDAHCDSIDQSTVSGLLYCNTVTSTFPNPADGPGPADQPPSTMPISDADIEEQKAAALLGGVIAATDPECSGGTYTIDSDTTLGPVKIECNLRIEKSSTDLTLTGQLWIEGNLTTKNGPTISIDASLDGKAVPIVVDNESDRITSSQVILQNSAVFSGHGAGSYVILISMNNDEEVGGSEVAIWSGQQAEGDILLYASHGEILLRNSGTFVGLAGLLLRLQQSAQVIYKTGAISLQFPDGPGGGYIIGEWSEVE